MILQTVLFKMAKSIVHKTITLQTYCIYQSCINCIPVFIKYWVFFMFQARFPLILFTISELEYKSPAHLHQGTFLKRNLSFRCFRLQFRLCLKSHPCFSFLPAPSSVSPRTLFLINHKNINHYLRVCFWRQDLFPS